MKSVIRNCVFETNSSSVHSIVIMMKDDGEKWEKEGLYYYNGDRKYYFKNLDENLRPVYGELYTEEEVLNFLKLIDYNYDEEEWKDDEGYYSEFSSVELFVRECYVGFYTYNMWCNNEYLEYDSNTYTTPKGEKIITYCKYGEDR